MLYDVLDTPVSPELLPPKDGDIAQKTEDLVGPYELHDFYLYYMLRFGFSPEKIFTLAVNAFAGVYEKETILKWLKYFIVDFSRSSSNVLSAGRTESRKRSSFAARRLENAKRRMRGVMAERVGTTAITVNNRNNRKQQG